MIDPSKLSTEDLVAIKIYNEEQFSVHLNAAHSAAVYGLELLADSLEKEAKQIRELLKGRAAHPGTKLTGFERR